MHSLFRPLHSPLAIWWNSEQGRAFRFHAGYFRVPILLILGALAVDKLIYYGALPLANDVAGEAHYFGARIAAAHGDDAAALKSIRAALLDTRTNPAFWRLAAEISTRLDSAEATYCWQQLDRLAPNSFATQIALADSALRHQQLDAALGVLNEVDPANREKIVFQCAAAKLADACGEQPLARAYFSNVEAARPTDAPTLFALAQWHAESNDPAQWMQARHQLMTLIGNPASASEARRKLIILDLKAGNQADARTCSDELLRSGHATFDDRVQRLNVLTGADLSGQLRELMRTTNPSEIALVLNWMATHGQAPSALAWVRRLPQAEQDDARIARAHAECLSTLGSWKSLRDLQSASYWPGEEQARLMYLARASLELGAEPDARAAWMQSVLACHDYPDYLALLNYLARNERNESSAQFWSWARVQVWSQMASRYPGQAWIVRALLQDALARHDSLRVENGWAQLAAIDPGDIDSAARSAQVSLLRGSRVEHASALLQSLHAGHPEDAVVTTACAFDCYRQGRFADALALLGGLTPKDLAAPERAPYLGALLAVAGPPDQASAYLQVAEAQPQLLPEESALVRRSRQLLAYRTTMAALLHGPPATPTSVSDPAHPSLLPDEDPALLRVAQCVALSRSGHSAEATQVLAGIDPSSLDSANLSIYLGGVLDLAGQKIKAMSYLELSPDLPFETRAQRFHEAVESWWNLQKGAPTDPARAAGLLAAYRGLDAEETSVAFWRADAPREMDFIRRALLHETAVEAVQERLHALLGRVPSTPEMQAECAYALLSQGQAGAARDRMEVLAPADLTRPQPALYYGLILAACGDRQRARPYLLLAEKSALLPEETALIARTGLAP